MGAEGESSAWCQSCFGARPWGAIKMPAGMAGAGAGDVPLSTDGFVLCWLLCVCLRCREPFARSCIDPDV